MEGGIPGPQEERVSPGKGGAEIANGKKERGNWGSSIKRRTGSESDSDIYKRLNTQRT